jgi:hypothetical protein
LPHLRTTNWRAVLVEERSDGCIGVAFAEAGELVSRGAFWALSQDDKIGRRQEARRDRALVTVRLSQQVRLARRCIGRDVGLSMCQDARHDAIGILWYRLASAVRFA